MSILLSTFSQRINFSIILLSTLCRWFASCFLHCLHKALSSFLLFVKHTYFCLIILIFGLKSYFLEKKDIIWSTFVTSIMSCGLSLVLVLFANFYLQLLLFLTCLLFIFFLPFVVPALLFRFVFSYQCIPFANAIIFHIKFMIFLMIS